MLLESIHLSGRFLVSNFDGILQILFVSHRPLQLIVGLAQHHLQLLHLEDSGMIKKHARGSVVSADAL